MELVTLFYLIDEFCKEYEPAWQQSLLDKGLKQRRSVSRLSLSEILTIIIYFHCSGYRMFKWYYENAGTRCEISRLYTSITSMYDKARLMRTV